MNRKLDTEKIFLVKICFFHQCISLMVNQRFHLGWKKQGRKTDPSKASMLDQRWSVFFDTPEYIYIPFCF